jgi:serine phosphatase RsbU (regulator of sigma subunit)
LKKARDALWGEMEIASRIQTALLPDKEKMSGLEISAIMLPAKEVGGDYYDVIENENGYKWITIGDVSGHGVDSGLIMMMAQTSILTAINNDPECKPSDVLNLVNKVMRENISRLVSDHFMTMMAIRFKDSKMMIAGKHQDIVIYRSALNKTETISNKGTWLGVVDDMRNYVHDVEIPLEDGDMVLLFTDGITESENTSGEMYGQKRLEVALNQYADLPVKKIVDKIIQKVESFQEKQQDDMTLLILKKLPSK